MKEYKIRKYGKDDPRYELLIQDSDNYNKDIQPLFIQRSDTSYYIPEIKKCWSEKYESCIDYHNPDYTATTPYDVVHNDEESCYTLKDINDNFFYDQSRIRIENFDSALDFFEWAFTGIGKFCGMILKELPFCPKWIGTKEGIITSSVCCLIIILLPCILYIVR